MTGGADPCARAQLAPRLAKWRMPVTALPLSAAIGTIPITNNHTFTDTFATESTHHIYKTTR